MIVIKADHLSEQHLAEIALAIQKRWNVATFVKMHEIILMDDDDTPIDGSDTGRVIKSAINPGEVERGINVIMENFELEHAFRLERKNRQRYRLKLVNPSALPKWLERANSDLRQPPEGVFVCPHCVLPETIILGDSKPIYEYKKGDSVIGSTGVGEVIRTFGRQYDGKIVNIKACGMLPIIMTPEHPILVASSNSTKIWGRNKSQKKILFSEEHWLQAKDVQPKNSNSDGDYVVVPIIRGNSNLDKLDLLQYTKSNHGRWRSYLPLDEDVAWLIGLYVAEGSIAKELRFSLSQKEVEIRGRIISIARRLGYSAYTQRMETSRAALVTISSRVLARAFDSWCGRKAPNKKIPDFILFHRDEGILAAFLEGYEQGDSYDNLNKYVGKIYRTSVTTSQTLAQQLQLAYARMGLWASIFRTRIATEGFIQGKRCSFHARYSISYALIPNRKCRQTRFVEGRVLCPIRQVRKMNYHGNVNNLETSDGTYLVSNAIVHNCGKYLGSELELSMHTKLHYII